MQNDLFEKAPVHKAYFSFALPVFFSMVISLIYNMADTYFIAGTGNTKSGSGCITWCTNLYIDDCSG